MNAPRVRVVWAVALTLASAVAHAQDADATLVDGVLAESPDAGVGPASDAPPGDETQARSDSAEARSDAVPSRAPGAPDAGTSAPTAEAPKPGDGLHLDTAAGRFTFWGSVELFYQWNFNDPSNGLTQFRAFDTRHNAITLQNVVLGTAWESRRAFARVTLQAGHTPFTYYLGEPALAGSAGASATGPQFWQFLQEVVAGYVFDEAGRFRVYGGLFLSPIGPESMNLKDDWFWSRSNLFYGLPFYHFGAVASLALTERWTVDAGVVNGWLNIVDNNPEKSVFAQAAWTSPREDFYFHVLYFGGVERPTGAPEGRAWRHLVDFVATWQANERLGLRFELNGGLEPNAFGLQSWVAGQLAARVQVTPWLFLAARGDVFVESVPSGASPIFFPAPWVTSGTATVEVRPVDPIALRLEYRHDHAGGRMYFGGRASTATFSLQDTLTLGVVAWF